MVTHGERKRSNVGKVATGVAQRCMFVVGLHGWAVILPPAWSRWVLWVSLARECLCATYAILLILSNKLDTCCSRLSRRQMKKTLTQIIEQKTEPHAEISQAKQKMAIACMIHPSVLVVLVC